MSELPGEEVSTWLDNIKKVWGLFCSALPALAIALFDHEETKVNRLKLDNEALQLQLKLKDNKDAVDQKFAGLSDADLVRQSIVDGGGSADSAPLAGVDTAIVEPKS